MKVDIRKLCEQDDRFMVFMQDLSFEMFMEIDGFEPVVMQAYAAYQNGVDLKQLVQMFVMLEKIGGSRS